MLLLHAIEHHFEVACTRQGGPRGDNGHNVADGTSALSVGIGRARADAVGTAERAGGEDLFEFLDEAPPTDRGPAALIIPSATVSPAPAVENREPPGYKAPLFFPFGKPEPTPPQLKLSGVSSFKKINSRLLQGGALSDREETDAIRELERALGVLGHQRRFLREQKISLETWTSDVYGFNLSAEVFPATQNVSATLKEDRKPEALKEETKQDADKHQHAKTVLREVRLSVKCKGVDKRRVDKTLLAQVDRAWSLRRPRPTDVKKTDVKKRAPCKLAAEKPSKRSKPPVPKVELTAVVEAVSVDSVVDEVVEDEPIKETSGASTDVPEAPGQLWNWLEDSTYFAPISTRQPLPEDLTLEAEDRLGRSSGVPLNVSESAPETVSEAGASNGAQPDSPQPDSSKDSEDIFRKRLTSALVVPDEAKQSKLEPGLARRKPRVSDGFQVLDVSRLSLEQRVLVQLNGIGLISSSSSNVQAGGKPTGRNDHDSRKLQRNLAERIKILNRCRVGLRKGIKAAI
eukprot:jgi/Undpi1/12347/HiC_scaffold_5.g02021.m1